MITRNPHSSQPEANNTIVRLKLIEKLAKIAQSRREAGEGTKLDVLTLDVQRLRLDADTAAKQLERAQARLTLARLMGRPSAQTEWHLSPWQAPAKVEGTEGSWVRSALIGRPEVQSKLWELAALGDDLTLARWEAWQGLQFGADAERDLVWSAGPSVALPLPLLDTGGARRDKAVATLIGARHELAGAQRQVVEDVRKAYATFHLAQAALAKVRDELSPLQDQRRSLAEAAYRAGEADLTTLLVADQDLQDTREKLIELREKAAVAYVRLQKAVGGVGSAAKVEP